MKTPILYRAYDPRTCDVFITKKYYYYYIIIIFIYIYIGRNVVTRSDQGHGHDAGWSIIT